MVRKFRSYSFLDFLVERGWEPELLNGISKFGLGMGGYGSILGISFLEMLRLFVLDDDCDNLQVVGGMESLARAFLFADDAPLTELIRYGTKVAGVRQRACGGLLVKCESIGTMLTSEVACDFVVMTAALPMCRLMRFEPQLSHDKQCAINEVHYTSSSKVFLQCRSRFWERRGVKGMAVSETLCKNTYFLPAFEGSDRGVILASYVWERDADLFLGLTHSERIRRAVDDLATFLPEVR